MGTGPPRLRPFPARPCETDDDVRASVGEGADGREGNDEPAVAGAAAAGRGVGRVPSADDPAEGAGDLLGS